ncbi:aldehyde dehydrogenase family protein [Sphingobium sp. TKS]|uniref:aldehyde dehydrogenase family protein n=1 Tax=Sphingobium sp. TKS TaxID=1315974 RepID=UPI00076FF294|nr:aldehyde dehydrogenase family protein [Sphingobium sp. TKS]AMK24139.1 benzaldehyde-derivatives dehydrogenase [Sphingobium sp. TKS]
MTYRMLIDGKLVEGASTLDVINPASGTSFASCARADAAQLDQAVAAAKRAFPAWSSLTYPERRAYLHRVAEALQARAEEVGTLLVQEQGKPFRQAQGEVAGAVSALRWFADQELPLEVIRDNEKEKIVEQRTPLGVVATIVPWNFPLALLANKVAPALITGNTVVAKPAPSTPLTGALLGEIVADILPPGVLNIVIDANELGAALSRHPDVAMISFTGSTVTGRRVMESASGSLKRLLLELGGNDAAIILDDADVKEVARRVFDGAMMNAGQVCLAVKRVYAPRTMYGELCDELARLASEVVVDEGLKQGAQMGPVQNKQQYERVLELIDDAKAKGTVVVGGDRLDRDGYFIAPTIVRDLPDDARLVREEQFGPVMPVLAYDDIDDVVQRANDSEYGLGGTIWTKDVERGMEIALRIQAGTVWVNKHLDGPMDVPFGGAKQSGIGRAKGVEGLKAFTQGKVINIAKV